MVIVKGFIFFKFHDLENTHTLCLEGNRMNENFQQEAIRLTKFMEALDRIKSKYVWQIIKIVRKN